MPLMDRLNEQRLPELPPIDEGGVMQTLVNVARYTGIPQLVGLTFEGIQRTDAAFRTGILTARGVIPKEQFPDYWRKAMNGELKDLSTSEFNKMFLGAQLYEQAKNVSLIPGWTKKVLNPETHMTEEEPVLSVGTALDFAADVWASPLTYMMAGGPGVVKVVSKTPLWSPFRAIGKGIGVIDGMIFSTASRFPILGNLMMHARELRHAMERWPQVTKDFETTRDQMSKALIEWSEKLHGMFYTENRGFLGIKHQRAVWSPEAEKAIMNDVFKLKVPGVRTKLTKEEQTFADRLHKEVGEPLITRLQDMGYMKRSASMADIMPSLVNVREIPADVLQSWDWKTLGWLQVPTYKMAKAKTLKKMALTADNLDLQTSIRDLVYAAEKKLHWNARHKVPITRTVKLPRSSRFARPSESPTLAGRAGGGTITRPGYRWENTGPLLKYRPTKSNNPLWQNKNVKDWSLGERSYITRLINEIQGKGRGRIVLELGEISRRFAYNLQDFAGKNRITKKLWEKLVPDEAGAKLGVYAKPQYATQFFIHNVVRSMLWGNLGAAIKNTSQLLNLATVQGIPATIKGMFELSNPERWQLAKSEVWHEFKRLLADEQWHKKLGTKLDDLMMMPFNATENLARGTAFNVYLDDFMKKNRIPGFDALMKHAKKDEAIRYAVHGAYDTNFIYGVLGRPASALGSPMFRPLTTLLSYGPKQLEFYRQVAKNDGSALLRAIGMHGLAIDLGNKWLGIAPESWLGWGFFPPMQSIDGVPLMSSPQVRWGLDIARGLGALGGGNEADAARLFRSAQGATGQILALPGQFMEQYSQGLLSPAHEFTRAVVAAGPQLGLFPVPIVAIAKTASTLHLLATYDPQKGYAEKPSQTGETWVPVTRADIARSVLFQTTTSKARQELSRMTADARNRIDRVLDERVRAYLTAAEGDNGDALVEAGRKLIEPIRISHGLVKQPPTTYIPMTEQIDSRLRRLIQNRNQSKDLTAMTDSGFLQDIYWAAWTDLMLKSEGLK